MEAMKPILFNTEMVRAILNGRKTVTRRVVKPPIKGVDRSFSPYVPGDILYVRETFAQPYGTGFFYAADYQDGDIVPADCGDVSVSKNLIKWRPSIHMPKEAARIFLLVTRVRVERLQEMTVSDYQAEGVLPTGYLTQYAIMTSDCFVRFKSIWDRTIKKSDLDRYGWDANPWVWVFEFERCEKPKGE